MLRILRRRLRHLCTSIWKLICKRRRPKVIIRRFGKLNPLGRLKRELRNSKSKVYTKTQLGDSISSKRAIKIATFNVAMFSLAPAVPKSENTGFFSQKSEEYNIFRSPLNYDYPKSILKSPLSPFSRSKKKVSINLLENEILVANEKEGSSNMSDKGYFKTQVPVRSPVLFPSSMANWQYDDYLTSSRTIMEVVREADCDILALQDVRAEEVRGMKPLSDLAAALGMHFVFAESWAPEYGNAVLSKWPIKSWKVQKIANDDDFRNLLKVTIQVPKTGEVNIWCTQLDHLDEKWRMKQINAVTQSVDADGPHILAGGLNSLERSDYTYERWLDIVKYYGQIGKPAPKVEVMKFLMGKGYTDSKDFAGECLPLVIMAKGQNVQGTCKYGTRVDYILTSPDSGYNIVPGSYSVISSKGTSDHHLVKLEIVIGKRPHNKI